MSIVIITGGSRGLGASAAVACAKRGMGVILTYKSSPDAASAVVRHIADDGGKAVALKLDVADSAAFPAFRGSVAATLRDVWGRADFDALVNNAGFGLFNPISAVTEEEFDSLYRVHLKGPFFLTQALLPLIADGGQILNVTSATSRVATAGVAPYAAFKGGLEVLTRYMAKEFGERRIRANAIAPGAIRTDLAGGIPADFEALLAGETALGRIGEPGDVGRLVASLLGDDFGWVNAQTIEVSGGYRI
jgi:NAD(P)-dependent dehydrogenase (short-subunit alcohol dehydrogenase family)